MKIRVRLFASLAASLNERELSLSVDPGATVGAAMDVLAQRYPLIARERGRLATAVDMAYVGDDHPLHDDAELAIIPPVSGG